MKRFFALALTGLLLSALAACGEAPADQVSFSDAPEAYRPLLGGILRLVQTAREEDGDWEWIHEPEMEDLEGQWLGGTDYTVKGNMGYAVADINGDGTPELLWLGKNRENPDEILLYALFTLKDGAPVRLFSRGLRWPGVLARDGMLYCAVQGGMMTNLISYRLEPGAAELTQADAYCRLWLGELESRFVYFRGDEEEYDEGQAIPQAEFETLQEQYLNPPDPMEFTFIPIEK
ncbi:MAG: hypothetical protein FWF60_07005 [Oscillospiraceae bacterium]|nr:hypothetical protein [Oscillospiraceae bacterium]